MKRLNQNGQTLIALLIFILVAMTITISSTAITIINLQGNASAENGEQALLNANSGIENALMILQRNPSYSGGTMIVDNGTDTITISGSTFLTITSVGTAGNNQRSITADATYNSNILTVTSWSETP